MADWIVRLAKRDSTANGAAMDMLLDRLRDLYGRISNDRFLRVEQERIPYVAALEALLTDS